MSDEWIFWTAQREPTRMEEVRSSTLLPPVGGTMFHRVFLCLSVTLLLAPTAPCAEPKAWKASAAKVDITPAGPMWMSGYAGRDKPAEGTLHKLWAKALVLEAP